MHPPPNNPFTNDCVFFFICFLKKKIACRQDDEVHNNGNNSSQEENIPWTLNSGQSKISIKGVRLKKLWRLYFNLPTDFDPFNLIDLFIMARHANCIFLSYHKQILYKLNVSLYEKNRVFLTKFPVFKSIYMYDTIRYIDLKSFKYASLR